MSKIEKTRQVIDEAIAKAARPVLTLSGGKDSLMLLDLCQSHRDRLHVVWARTSETFPHMVDFVRRCVEGWDYVELVSNQARFFARKGLPSALIPVRHRPHEQNPGVRIQSNGYCCKDLQYRPLARYIKRYGADLVLHGQTAEDLRNAKSSFPKMLRPLRPEQLVAPLDAWTAAEVLDYCAAHDLALPLQYQDGLEDSLECWNCTVRTDLRRFQWMQKRCPALADKLGALMAEVYGAAMLDYETHIKPVLDAAKKKPVGRLR